ncbi:MAG: GDSL-type esterase/lipase family protein [Chitinispirillia bacterium]
MSFCELFRNRIIGVWLLWLVLGVSVQGATRVCCIGNSITRGKYDENPVSKLGKLLGSEFNVLNCGVGSATLLKNGNKPYYKQSKYKAAKEFKPNIVTIMLGTNDSKSFNWGKYGGEFRKDYTDMIEELTALTPSPKILLVIPPSSKNNNQVVGINDKVIHEEMGPIIRSLAKEKGLSFVDCYTPTACRMDLFPDLVHPSDGGNKILADVLYEGIQFLVMKKTPAEKLLWYGDAPGAKGDSPNDKPELIVYPATGNNNKGTAVIVCPGGAYSKLLIEKQGSNVAKWLNKNGITAFVLRYRYSPYQHPFPLGDVKRAMRTVRYHAENYNLDTTKIGIMGFSAGGHLASTLLTHFDDGKPDSEDFLERKKSRPDFGILIYPVITLKGEYAHKNSCNNLLGISRSQKLIDSLSNHLMVTSETPMTFLAHGDADKEVPYQNSEMFNSALKAKGVESEFILEKGKDHGFSMENARWPDSCIKWLREHNFLQPTSAIPNFRISYPKKIQLNRKVLVVRSNGPQNGFLPFGTYLFMEAGTPFNTGGKIFNIQGKLIRP